MSTASTTRIVSTTTQTPFQSSSTKPQSNGAPFNAKQIIQNEMNAAVEEMNVTKVLNSTITVLNGTINEMKGTLASHTATLLNRTSVEKREMTNAVEELNKALCKMNRTFEGLNSPSIPYVVTALNQTETDSKIEELKNKYHPLLNATLISAKPENKLQCMEMGAKFLNNLSTYNAQNVFDVLHLIKEGVCTSEASPMCMNSFIKELQPNQYHSTIIQGTPKDFATTTEELRKELADLQDDIKKVIDEETSLPQIQQDITKLKEEVVDYETSCELLKKKQEELLGQLIKKNKKDLSKEEVNKNNMTLEIIEKNKTSIEGFEKNIRERGMDIQGLTKKLESAKATIPKKIKAHSRHMQILQKRMKAAVNEKNLIYQESNSKITLSNRICLVYKIMDNNTKSLKTSIHYFDNLIEWVKTIQAIENDKGMKKLYP